MVFIRRRDFLEKSSYFGLYFLLGQKNTNFLSFKSQEMNRLTMQLDWEYNVQFAGVLLADYYELYAKKGLDVEIKPWDIGIRVPEVVAENQAIIGCAEQDAILAAQAEGKPIKAVATMFQASLLGLMSLPSRNIQSLHDLVGKKVGFHRGSQKIMDLVMGYCDISPGEIEIVDISYGDNSNLLLEGKVDALQCYIVDEPIGFAEKTGIKPTVLKLKDYGYDAYVQTIFVHERLLKEKRDQVYVFLEAMFEGWKLALQNIPKAAEIVVNSYVNQESKYNDLVYQIKSLELIADGLIFGGESNPKIGAISPARWQVMAERLVQYGIIKKAPKFSDSLDLTVWSV